MSVVADFELFFGFGHDLFVFFFAVAGLFDLRVSKLVACRNFLRGFDVAVHVFHK